MISGRKPARAEKEFEGPMQAIAGHLSALEDPEEVTNRVFMYLLGKSGDPGVDEVLRKFYEWTVALSREWIVSGQRHGVIPESVDPDKTAELFMLISCGMRMRSAIPVRPFSTPVIFHP